MIIEKTILDYLSSVLECPVAMEKPDSYEELVLIDKTGSSESNHLYRATIAIQSYAPKLLKAAELNEKVKEAMRGLITLDSITRCQLNSDYNFSNTITKEYRYQAVFDINHY